MAEIAQLVEHDLAKVGVAGSSPVFRSFLFNNFDIYFPAARVAELVDALDLKSSGLLYGCAGSSPAPGTKKGTAPVTHCPFYSYGRCPHFPL